MIPPKMILKMITTTLVEEFVLARRGVAGEEVVGDAVAMA
jgi:hypothetical protein